VLADKAQPPLFNEIDMTKAMALFKQKYVFDDERVLIFFSPANELTRRIMEHALAILGLEAKNKIDMTGRAGYGAVGDNNVNLACGLDRMTYVMRISKFNP
jgi:hypothetical protein